MQEPRTGSAGTLIADTHGQKKGQRTRHKEVHDE